MKYLAASGLIIFAIFSLSLGRISDNLTNNLFGKWRFSERFADPGDGSGKWEKIPDSVKKFLLFYKNGKVGGNYFTDALCYKVTRKKTIAITSTDKKIENYFYNVNKRTLEISPGYPSFCFEGCSYKFVRVK